MEQSVVGFVLSRLSVLSDDELANLDFDSALAALDDSLSDSEKQQLARIFTTIRNELGIRHHGVKGMKWGVRRYQNKDGTLTEAGKRRLADANAKSSIFGTAQKYSIKTRSGENISVEPRKPPSIGAKIWRALMDTGPELGERGDANYTLNDSSGNKIGELSLISKSADVAYVDWITVDEKQRGKGYATDVLNDLIGKAREYGYSKVELNALKKPRPLYERLGFTYSDRSEVDIITRISEWELGTKRMEYDLRKEITHMESTKHTIYTVAGKEFELQHYGVKGMKWGHRKAREEYKKLDVAKGQYNHARKAYARSSYYYSNNNHGNYSLNRAKRAESAARFEDANRDAARLRETKKAYKDQKKEVRKNAPVSAKLERGAKAVGRGLAVVGGLYVADQMYLGGAVTRAAKTTVPKVLSAIGDQMFDYAILDAAGNVLRRYN